MEKIGLNELREMFLSFYQSKEHYRRQSFSLVPHNDKSLLLINSGWLLLNHILPVCRHRQARE